MSANRRTEDISALTGQIRSLFNEDPTNLDWALQKVQRLSWSVGEGLYSGLLLLMANLAFSEAEARQHWAAILNHRARLEKQLGRPVALRVAILDHFVGVNRGESKPRLLELAGVSRASDRELIDPITGLHTPGFLEDQLPREISRAHRYKLDLSFVNLEIDELPRILEELGQTMGPILLKETATIIRSSIRSIDYAVRLSAARFGLLLTETDRMGAYHVADRIRQRVEAFNLEREVNGQPFELTISAGVASFPHDADEGNALMCKARAAFFTSRARGPGRVSIHYPERREYLRLAVDNENLQVTLGPEGAAPRGSMRNISSGGILFESETPIELGRSVEVRCKNRRDGEKVAIPGKVVRIEAFESESGPRYEIGVLFDLVVEEQVDGVIDFLERLSGGGPDEPVNG